MKSSRLQTVILVLSVAAIVAGVYLGFRLFGTLALDFLPEFVSPGKVEKEAGKPKPSAQPELDVEVVLPEELTDELEISRERQRQLFERARSAHRGGDLVEARRLYRRVLSTSGQSRLAARSYRYLGDIRTVRQEYEEARRLYDYSISVVDTSPTTYYRRGRVREQLEDFDGALSDYSGAIEVDSRPIFLLARGNLRFRRDKLEQALEDYTRGLEGETLKVRLHFNRALVHQRLGASGAALEDFREASRYVSEPDRRYQLEVAWADALIGQRKFDQARRRLLEAREVNSTPAVLYNLSLVNLRRGDTPAALGVLEPARDLETGETGPVSRQDIHTQLGYLYQETGNYEAAIEAYGEALELAGNKIPLYFAIGRLYEMNDQPGEALNYYRGVLEAEEVDEKYQRLIYRRVGELSLELKRPENAKPAFRNVLALDPDSHEARYDLGVAHYRTDDLAAAIEAFRKASQQLPRNQKYRYVLAKTLYWHGNRKEARRQFKRILDQDSKHLPAARMVAYLDYQWGKMQAARRRYESLLGRVEKPRLRARMLQQLGNVSLRREEFEKALDFYRKSLNEKELPETYYNIALVFLLRDDDRAIAALEKAQQEMGESYRVRTALGYVLKNRGLLQEARAQLERAVELKPDSIRARFDLSKVREKLEAAGDAE